MAFNQYFTKILHIVSYEVWDLVYNDFMTGNIPPPLAETLIVPIPKIDSPTSLKEFYPISKVINIESLCRLVGASMSRF